jgi:hypothetical protein
MNSLNIFFFLTIPSIIDNYLYMAFNSGNLLLYEVFLDLYVKRNLLYFSFGFLLLSYLYYNIYCGIVLFVISLYRFIISYLKYYNIIKLYF